MRRQAREIQKYGPLADLLRSVPEGQRTVTLTFAEVEAVVGPLPAGAFDLRQWWADDAHGRASTWPCPGWRVDRTGLDLDGQTVRFARTAARARSARPIRR